MLRPRFQPLARAALIAALALAGATARAQIQLNVFIPGTGGSPISISYAGDMFVGSNYFSNQLYSTNLSGGNLQNFGPPIFSGGDPGNGEHFVASSLGLGGFPNRDVYVAVSNDIARINHAGTAINTFASGFSGIVRGILFDTVGTFGHDMLVTTNSGNIYRVDSAGTKTLIASVGEDTEGLDIAPLGANFGAFDGQLIVASEGTGTIRAISNTGVVSPVANVPSAEELTFVPVNLGASGSPVEGFYGADYSVDVLKANPSEFTNFLGDVIVTGETTHQVSRIHWDGSNFAVSNIGTFPNQPEDGIFVTAALIGGPGPGPGSVPEPGALSLLLGGGLSGLWAFGRLRRA